MAARRRQRNIPTVEWVAILVGGAIVVGTIGYLAFETIASHASEPILRVQMTGVREQDRSVAVDVEVANVGGSAAANVEIGGTARASDGRESHPRAHLDYVPGFSKRTATLVFDFDPGPNPDVRVLGYTRP